MAGNSLIDAEFIEEDDPLDLPERDEMQPVETGRPKQKAKDADPLEVEVIDDTPEKDRGKWVADDEKDGEPDIPDEDEVKSYSDVVQKRIAKMTARMHAERRAAEQHAREKQEALTIAQRLIAENNQLKGIVENGEKVLIGEHKGRLEGMLAQAKAAYREAQEAGDTNGIIAAQEQMARAVAQMDRLSTHRPQQLQREDVAALQQRFQPQAQQPQVDPKAADWQTKNNWFGRDEGMTAYAMAVHTKLVNREGISPNDPEYYQKIDAEMQKRFPEKFEKAPAPRRTQTVVAPANRAGSSAPRKVQLTESQARIARRIGLTLEQYAEQLLVEQEKGNGKDFTHFARP